MPRSKNDQRLFEKRRLLFALTLVVCVAALFLGGARSFLSAHAKFGRTYKTTAIDGEDPDRSHFAKFLKDCLPSAIVRSSYFTSRFDGPQYFRLRDAQLEWQIAGLNSGWLFFNQDLRWGKLLDKWEFAPCAETNLVNITNIPVVFYGVSDNCGDAFGKNGASGNCIRVGAGQIVFARRTGEQKRIYILKFEEQNYYRQMVDYCVTTQQ